MILLWCLRPSLLMDLVSSLPWTSILAMMITMVSVGSNCFCRNSTRRPYVGLITLPLSLQQAQSDPKQPEFRLRIRVRLRVRVRVRGGIRVMVRVRASIRVGVSRVGTSSNRQDGGRRCV